MVKMIMMMMMRCCAARPYFSGFTYALKLQMCNWCPEPNARATLSSLSRTRQLEELHHSESALRKENQEIRGVGGLPKASLLLLAISDRACARVRTQFQIEAWIEKLSQI